MAAKRLRKHMKEEEQGETENDQSNATAVESLGKFIM